LTITEDFVTTSLFTLVGIEGEDEVTVLDEVSSMSIDTKPLDWCVAAFIAPNIQGMGSLKGDSSNNLLGKLLVSQGSWLDSNLDSQLVPTTEWARGSSGSWLPNLGVNTIYDYSPLEQDSGWGLLPIVSAGAYRRTTAIPTKVSGGWNKPYVYYGVSPFLGIGTEIPIGVSQVVFNKLCTLIDNPAGVHLIVLGDCGKAQSLFGSGFWGLRQFLIDYLGVVPSGISTPLSVPLPFMYSVHVEVPDLEILVNKYTSPAKDICAFENKSIGHMLDLMWSILYFDYTYLGADPVIQDCLVAGSWQVPGRSTSERVPFNNPALVLLISGYTQHLQNNTEGAYLPDVDVTHRVICRSFLKGYKQVQYFIEYDSPYSKCLSSMADYSKSFAISMYRRTCSKKHIVMPGGKVYPKKTEVRRDIARSYDFFEEDRSLTTYIKVFSRLWEKVLWDRLLSGEGSSVPVFSFLSRSYNLPLSTLLTNSCTSKSLGTTLSKSSLLDMVVADTNSYFLTTLSKVAPDVPAVGFSGHGSIPTVRNAVTIMLGMYADQVVYALEQDRYSVIQKDSFDRWDFDSLAESSKSFENFIKGVKVRRAWVQEDNTLLPKAYMSLEGMIKLWQHTNCEGLHKVLEVLVSMLTGLEVDVPAPMTKGMSYRTRIMHRIGIASIKKKLLDVMSQTEAGSKLGQ
jgi:hypothetical protein